MKKKFHSLNFHTLLLLHSFVFFLMLFSVSAMTAIWLCTSQLHPFSLHFGKATWSVIWGPSENFINFKHTLITNDNSFFEYNGHFETEVSVKCEKQRST